MIALLLTQLAFADIERIAVLDFVSSSEEEWIGVLADQVRAGALSELDPLEYSVITRENMMQFLDDMGKDVSCIEGSCEVELARNIGADFVISGAVSKIEEVYIINMKLHNSHSGQLLGLEKLQSSDPLQLIENIQEVTEEMVQVIDPEDAVSGNKKTEEKKPTDLEFLLRTLDARTLYLDLGNGEIKLTQSQDTAKIVFSEFRIDRGSTRQDDRFLLPLDNPKIYYVGYIEDIPSKFTRSLMPIALQNEVQKIDFVSRNLLSHYIPTSTHDIAGTISLDGDIENVHLKGFDFEGRYRLQTGFLNPTGDSLFQDINQYFVVDEYSELLRPRDIE